MNKQIELILKSDKRASQMMEEAHAEARELREETKQRVDAVMNKAKKEVKLVYSSIFEEAENAIKLQKMVLQNNSAKTFEHFQRVIRSHLTKCHNIISKRLITG